MSSKNPINRLAKVIKKHKGLKYSDALRVSSNLHGFESYEHFLESESHGNIGSHVLNEYLEALNNLEERLGE